MNRPRVSAALLRQITAAHAARPVDVFFSYFYDACISPETIDAIRAMGVVTLNWYCNASYQLSLVSEISPHYDYCLVPEKFRLQDYERLGAHPLYCQEAANPNIYQPHGGPVEFDVTFVGQKYADRAEYVRFLLDAGVDVRVWGPGWLNTPTGDASHTPLNVRPMMALLREEGWRSLARKVKRTLRPSNHPGGF